MTVSHTTPPTANNTSAEALQQQEDEDMTKTLDLIDETIRNSKHPFRQVADRPDKPTKHRYERRKVKEYMKLADWTAEQAPQT